MDYEYKRKDGGTISCYGELLEDSNIIVTCDNEYHDFEILDNELNTWFKVCKSLEAKYPKIQVEQLEAC